MGSIFGLPSWSMKQMTQKQKTKFRIEEVGESFHSGRKCFKVTCVKCGSCLHENTNDPSFHMELHPDNCSRDKGE